MKSIPIHVLYGDVQTLLDPHRFWMYEQRMAPLRRDKIRRMRTPEGKALSLGAGILLQTIQKAVGADVKLDPRLGPHGKPELKDVPEVSFNLSHSGTRVFACYARGKGVQVGCDVEEANRKLELIPEIAARFFSKAEQEQLQGISAEEKRSRFYRIWTLKESLLKAQGCGISRALDSFTILLPGDAAESPQILFQDSVETASHFREGKRYALKEWRLSPEEYWSTCIEIEGEQNLTSEVSYQLEEQVF